MLEHDRFREGFEAGWSERLKQETSNLAVWADQIDQQLDQRAWFIRGFWAGFLTVAVPACIIVLWLAYP
jgi:hypothetical protein